MEKQKHIMWVDRAPRMQTFGEATARAAEYLRCLQSLHPDFSYWETVTDKGFVPIAADLSDFSARMRVTERPDKGRLQDYSHLDAEFNLTDASEARFGFHFSLQTSTKNFLGGHNPGRADNIELRINIDPLNCGVVLKFPAGRPDLVTYDNLRNIMMASIDLWAADKAQVFTPAFANALEERRGRRIGLLRAVWMCYLRHMPLAACIRSDLPGGLLERLGEDALLFTLGRRSPDPENEHDMAQAEILQALFDSFHFDHEVTLYGWPYDPEEPRYTSQVTGAPADRVYVVGFCAFDGYDAERGVLLFARLFRLPSNWGTDLLPYYRKNEERLESLPYVVQARQHIAAVRYVGADTPIEWHVGSEETATALKTLLNDWAAIPVEQLRVVYTPFEGRIDEDPPCL